jgi:hypothetical protein
MLVRTSFQSASRSPVRLKGRQAAKAQLEIGKCFLALTPKIRGLAQRIHDRNRNTAVIGNGKQRNNPASLPIESEDRGAALARDYFGETSAGSQQKPLAGDYHPAADRGGFGLENPFSFKVVELRHKIPPHRRGASENRVRVI